jgi:hypothetical protein
MTTRRKPHKRMGEAVRRPRAKEELRDWAAARRYWNRAAESLEVARNESDPDVRNRYVTIAHHYRQLAEAAERSANQKGVERRREHRK